MRKLLTLSCILMSLLCKGQIIQYLGSPTTQIYVRGQLRVDTIVYLPINDTTIRPSQKGAVVFRNADNGLYIWTGASWSRIAVGSTAWGQITGTITAQTDLVALLNTYQPLLSAGYGIKLTGNTLLYDSAVARKVDTVLRLNDSTISYTINGASHNVLIRGTSGGGISSLTLGLPTGLFSTPLVFNNNAGTWSDTAVLLNQSPGTVFAGPASGGSAIPAFRALAISDLPTGIPNAYLQNSFIAFNTGTSGTDINWSSSPVALGATATLNIPSGSSSARGLLTPSVYNTFFAKADSTSISNDSVYDWHNGSPVFRYLIVTASSGITSLNGLTASSQTFANSTTGSDFSISSSGTTHTFNLPLSSVSTTGKLASTDFATFLGKQDALSGTGYVKFAGTTPSYLTPTQVTADLNLFTTSNKGLVPAPGAINGFFLGDDAAWHAGTIGGITALTGDVVASGPGSVPATIQSNAVTTSKINNAAVTYAKMQAVSGPALLGSVAGGTVGEIPLGAGVAFSGGSLIATAAPKDTAGINLLRMQDGGISYLHASTILPIGDTFYILSSGQSNAGFPSNTGPIGDTATDPRVQIWDWFSGTWVTATPGVEPFTADGFTHSGNIAWYFAKKMAQTTGKHVRIVVHYKPSTAISGWFNGTTKGPQLDSLINKATASGVSRFNCFIWDQGENDPVTPMNTYLQAYDSIKAYLRRQNFFKPMTPIIAVGMPQVYQGSTINAVYADRTLRTVDGNQDQWDIYANTDSATVQVGQPHFDNPGQKIIGLNIYNCYSRLPYILPTTRVHVGYLKLFDNDSLPDAAAETQQIALQNNSGHGTSGILITDSTGTSIARILAPNGSTAFSPFAVNEFVLSAEHGNSAIAGYVGFTKRFLINGSGISTFGGAVQTQTSTALFNNYDFVGQDNTRTWLIGGTGTTYSNAPTPQGYFVLYNLANGTILSASPNGLFRLGVPTATNTARLALDANLTAAQAAGNGALFTTGVGTINDNSTALNTTLPYVAVNTIQQDTLNANANGVVDSVAVSFSIAGAPVSNLTNHTVIKVPLSFDVRAGNSQMNGTLRLTDTLKTPNIARKLLDTINYKPIVVDASGNHFKTDWATFGGSAVTTVGAFSGSSQTNGASIATNTITFGPADATNPGMIKSTGSQTLGATLTLPAPLLTGLGTPGANDSLVTVDPSTGQTRRTGRIFSGSYTSTFTNTTNITSSGLISAYYSRINNIVHVTISGNITPTTGSANTVLTFSLPFTTGSGTQSYIGQGVVNVNATTYVSGLVSINSGTTGTLSFLPGITVGTGGFSLSFDYTL